MNVLNNDRNPNEITGEFSTQRSENNTNFRDMKRPEVVRKSGAAPAADAH